MWGWTEGNAGGNEPIFNKPSKHHVRSSEAEEQRSSLKSVSEMSWRGLGTQAGSGRGVVAGRTGGHFSLQLQLYPHSLFN